MNLRSNLRDTGRNFKDGKKIRIHMFNKELSGLRAAEVLLVCFLLIYMALIFFRGNSRNVDMQVISKSMAGQCDLEGLQPGDAGTMKRFFGLDSSQYEGYMLYVSDNLMNVDEMLIVKISDTSQLNELEDAVNEHLDGQIRNFHGYGTNQEALLQNAVIQERGKYFFYAVSDRAEQWEEVFLSCIR